MKLSRLKMGLGVAVLALLPATSFADITGTDHDFTALAGNTQAIGLCTFCHTPHKAKSTLLLWNHTLSANTFSWDVPTTTAGTQFPTISGATYKGPTTKCLSCHDGSVAVGDIGWFDYDTNGAAGVVINTATMLTLSPDGSHVIGASGAMAGNHPVAMPYPWAQVANTYNGMTTGPAAILTDWQMDPSTNASPAKVRLFNDDGSGNISAGAVAAKTGIECSSCHDPHNRAVPVVGTTPYFLRGNLTGSTMADGYLCLQCHIK